MTGEGTKVQRPMVAPGMKQYEVRIYNAEVRELLESGEPNNTAWADRWADAHYMSVQAKNEEDAKNILFRQYPERQGFIISHVIEISTDESGISFDD